MNGMTSSVDLTSKELDDVAKEVVQVMLNGGGKENATSATISIMAKRKLYYGRAGEIIRRANIAYQEEMTRRKHSSQESTHFFSLAAATHAAAAKQEELF